MKRSYLTNLLLLTLMIALLWQLDRVQAPDMVTTIGGELSPAMVQNITIQRAQQNTIKIIRSNDGWQLEQPFNAPASDSRLKMLLSLLDTVPGEQFIIDADLDLSQLGLAEPQLTVIFNDTEFVFGDIEKLSEQRYLRVDGRVYLFNDSISPLLQASASGFIENRLFVDMGDLNELTLAYQSEHMLQDKKMVLQLKVGQWQSPDDGFSADKLTAMAQAWQSAYAMQVSHDPTPPGEEFIPLQFTFDSQQTLKAYARLSSQGLSVMIPARQLQYQFPAISADTLFPALPAKSESN